MGKNKNVGCGCDYCMSRGPRRDFRQGGVDDGWEDVPYRKSGRSHWKGRRKRPCKKSKTNEQCDFSGWAVKGTQPIRDEATGKVIGYRPRMIRVCSRCGKEDWSYNDYW